jgi:hypothetical protein
MSRRYGAFLPEAAVGLLLCLAPSFTRAQVTVVRNGAQVDEAKVKVLFNTACRVVAEEFHLPNLGDALFHVTLVLGDAKDTVIGDELHKTYFIYMQRWDEVQFATAASRLALQHLVSQERKTRMVAEILRRARATETVSYESLFDAKKERRASFK